VEYINFYARNPLNRMGKGNHEIYYPPQYKDIIIKDIEETREKIDSKASNEDKEKTKNIFNGLCILIYNLN
jgi:hypothetical protein